MTGPVCIARLTTEIVLPTLPLLRFASVGLTQALTVSPTSLVSLLLQSSLLTEAFLFSFLDLLLKWMWIRIIDRVTTAATDRMRLWTAGTLSSAALTWLTPGTVVFCGALLYSYAVGLLR